MSSTRCSFAHHMNKELPVINHTIEDRSGRRNYEMHMQRLAGIKSMVDNKAPPTQWHMRANAKRAQIQHERSYAIECENALLLEKMRRIMELGTSASNKGLPVPEEVEPQSLNAGRRRRELQRITNENMGIVSRIQASDSAYDTTEWHRERKVVEQMLSRISRYRGPRLPDGGYSSLMGPEDEEMGSRAYSQPRPYRVPPLQGQPSSPPFSTYGSAGGSAGGSTKKAIKSPVGKSLLGLGPPKHLGLEILSLPRSLPAKSQAPPLKIKFHINLK